MHKYYYTLTIQHIRVLTESSLGALGEFSYIMKIYIMKNEKWTRFIIFFIYCKKLAYPNIFKALLFDLIELIYYAAKIENQSL